VSRILHIYAYQFTLCHAVHAITLDKHTFTPPNNIGNPASVVLKNLSHRHHNILTKHSSTAKQHM